MTGHGSGDDDTMGRRRSRTTEETRTTRRGLRRDDAAVSSVIGAILVTGLLVISLITVRTVYVPVWKEQAERAEMDLVATQLGQIKADLDRHVGNRNASAVAATLLLGQQRTGLFMDQGLPNQVSFEPGGKGVGIHANRMRILVQNGSATASVNESWEDVPGSDTITNVSRVHHLRLRIDCVGGCESTGDNIVISITDADGNFAGDFRVQQTSDPPDNFLNIRTRDADGDVLVDQPTAFFGTTSVSPFWVWANDPTWRFDQVLAAAKKPMTLTVTENGLEGDIAITYTEEDADGNQVLVGGGGPVEEPFRRAFPGGALTYRSLNSQFVNQDWVLENGALVLDQSGSAVLRVPPHMQGALVGNRTSLTFLLPSLQGAATATAGQGSVSVTTTAGSRFDVQGEVPRFSVNVTTDYPALWARHWNDTMEAAGLSDVAPSHFNVTTGSTWANVTVFGTTTDPASTDYDITVTFRRTAVHMAIRP